MAIFGSSNLSDSGDLLIFNKVSYKTLLMFEKELGRDRMTYLVEEGLPPDTATASHLESTKADGILFQAGGSDPVALRSAIMERINEGRRVVFLPGPVSHVKGSISQIPPRVIKALEALHISPVPVYAGFYTNSVLDAEADTDAQADIQIHILPKLAPGAEMAARLTSAWLECSAQAYATLPQLHGSLSALLFRSLKLHSDCRVIDGIDDTTLTYGQLLAISVAFAKRLKKITSNRRVGIILPPGNSQSGLPVRRENTGKFQLFRLGRSLCQLCKAIRRGLVYYCGYLHAKAPEFPVAPPAGSDPHGAGNSPA